MQRPVEFETLQFEAIVPKTVSQAKRRTHYINYEPSVAPIPRLDTAGIENLPRVARKDSFRIPSERRRTHRVHFVEHLNESETLEEPKTPVFVFTPAIDSHL